MVLHIQAFLLSEKVFIENHLKEISKSYKPITNSKTVKIFWKLWRSELGTWMTIDPHIRLPCARDSDFCPVGSRSTTICTCRCGERTHDPLYIVSMAGATPTDTVCRDIGRLMYISTCSITVSLLSLPLSPVDFFVRLPTDDTSSFLYACVQCWRSGEPFRRRANGRHM